ncbi:MAG: four helix bundle protein [Bacteroidia bacterium]
MKITELEVWKAGLDLSKSVFDLSEKFPANESNGLSFQLRRAVTYIPSNIAAAASRKYGKESLKYLSKAKAFLYETETLLYLAEKLRYINEQELEEIIESLDTSRRLLFGFIKYYKRSSSSTQAG